MKNDYSKQVHITTQRDTITLNKGAVTKEQVSTQETICFSEVDYDPILKLLYTMYLENQKSIPTQETYKEAI